MHLQRPFWVATLLSVGLLAACGEKPKTATQAAVRVNDGEITVHQINQALQQQRGLKPEQLDSASRQVLERLIDQELAVQSAVAQKLDRDPKVVAAMEAAKREIIARAYAEQVAEAVAKPSAQEVQQYYDDKPALFAKRRAYTLQEFTLKAGSIDPALLDTKMTQARNANEVAAALTAMDVRFEVSQSTQGAESLPMSVVDKIGTLNVGQNLVLAQGGKPLKVLHIAAAQPGPVSLEQATPAIEQFILNERKRQAVEAAIKAARSSAKIEYQGKFAEPAAAAASAAPALTPAPTPAAAPASQKLDDATLKKGLGLQ
ncbi:EpsD family peptidyl-prolyl cis-trans isomerase [Ideonella paludis]|uniref:EpsD family peptidyl-prolyl cis-trans isomerase n=1 Tax=Ideonella paludis TaxID=1233411 RepID=A0ABS5DRE0_9BURK|nr:EpsD family peptidyl-prolyl cis-trans isomerase [Ideonella paludis]MBQ0933712.1 EpsD family peptidyl-prolyl cis-trans isomerase [Ideonella paludis]